MPTDPSRERSRRKSRVVYDFTLEKLKKYSHMRQDQAARALGVSPITLKRICHRHGYRWPYRAMKAQARRVRKQLEEASAAMQLPRSSVSLSITTAPKMRPTVERHEMDQPDYQPKRKIVALPHRFPLTSEPDSYNIHLTHCNVAFTLTQLLPRHPESPPPVTSSQEMLPVCQPNPSVPTKHGRSFFSSSAVQDQSSVIVYVSPVSANDESLTQEYQQRRSYD